MCAVNLVSQHWQHFLPGSRAIFEWRSFYLAYNGPRAAMGRGPHVLRARLRFCSAPGRRVAVLWPWLPGASCAQPSGLSSCARACSAFLFFPHFATASAGRVFVQRWSTEQRYDAARTAMAILRSCQRRGVPCSRYRGQAVGRRCACRLVHRVLVVFCYGHGLHEALMLRLCFSQRCRCMAAWVPTLLPTLVYARPFGSSCAMGMGFATLPPQCAPRRLSSYCRGASTVLLRFRSMVIASSSWVLTSEARLRSSCVVILCHWSLFGCRK